jgi:cation diffusion facilitator CzcD-associated flavoprotein CzcO
VTPAPHQAVERTSLLVIGAGPYGVATAARARARGIDTLIVGRRMALWRDHMPAGMFLRSGPDWHLDADGLHTFAAFLEDQRTPFTSVEPVPIATFLAYTDWFISEKALAIRDDWVTRLTRAGDGFEAELASGTRVIADRVVSATGIARFQRLPAWASALPAGVATHSCDLIDFACVRGIRLIIIGGRQSAYEWAALAADHGAARIDVVHRHATPRFEKVSWRFVDPYIEQTLAERGWWRTLPPARRQAIAREFWEVGRLTLEAWLTPRLPADRVILRPNAFVTDVTARPPGIAVALSTGDVLEADRIVLATGYEPNLANLDYLTPLLNDIQQVDGFPVLDEAFQSSVIGLYFTGFAATRDFGPFFGFTKGCPAAATIVVDGLLGVA